LKKREGTHTHVPLDCGGLLASAAEGD